MGASVAALALNKQAIIVILALTMTAGPLHVTSSQEFVHHGSIA